MVTTIVLVIALYFSTHWSYILVMGAKDALERGDLTFYWKVMIMPAAIVGVLLDVAFNYTFGWMFLAVPQWPLFSGTVKHHYRRSDGWRLKLATFFARNLNVFDPTHITKDKG